MERVWIQKPDENLISLMNESVELELYLVHENGPLSFTFKDEVNQKISISIGNSIKCSCESFKNNYKILNDKVLKDDKNSKNIMQIENSISKRSKSTNKLKLNDQKKSIHCIHTIYVLNRIFKLNFSNPLIFQNSFSDSEINKLIELRNKKNNEKDKKREQVCIKKSKKQGFKLKERNLIDDYSCSICQDDMYTNDGLYCCYNSCGHHFHLKCLSVWITHKLSGRDKITCPMCRSVWKSDDLIKDSIIEDTGFETYKVKLNNKNTLANKNLHKNINCSNCGRLNIKYERYRCINLENADYCTECYNVLDHDPMNYFIVKKSENEKWYMIENDRINHIFNGNKEELATNIFVYKTKLSNILSCFLKDFSLNEDQNNMNNFSKNVEINTCFSCKKNKSSHLHDWKFKFLPLCFHSIHNKCSEKLFSIKEINGKSCVDKNFNFCIDCNSYIFKGLNGIFSNINANNEENSKEGSKIINSNLKALPSINITNSPYNSNEIIFNKLKNNDNNTNTNKISSKSDRSKLHFPDKNFKVNDNRFLPNILNNNIANMLVIQKIDFTENKNEQNNLDLHSKYVMLFKNKEKLGNQSLKTRKYNT